MKARFWRRQEVAIARCKFLNSPSKTHPFQMQQHFQHIPITLYPSVSWFMCHTFRLIHKCGAPAPISLLADMPVAPALQEHPDIQHLPTCSPLSCTFGCPSMIYILCASLYMMLLRPIIPHIHAISKVTFSSQSFPFKYILLYMIVVHVHACLPFYPAWPTEQGQSLQLLSPDQPGDDADADADAEQKVDEDPYR